jgi:hypothetical protein
MTPKFNSDIDIDMGDRDQLLSLVKHLPASIREDKTVRRHNTGVYPTRIPYDPITGMSAIDYREAESRGYVKLDILNVSIYRLVRDENHLTSLMRDPDWSMLTDRTVMEKIIHINRHYDTMMRMPEPINSIPRMAMFLALIRPGKRHLIGKTWREVAESIWNKDGDLYTFKKSHAVAYANLVVVNMNLYEEMPTAFSEQGLSTDA